MKLLLVLIALTTLCTTARADVTITINVDSPDAYAFEGWGTSLCWWAHRVGGWQEESLDPLLDAITDPVEGLGLTVFRYNLGGGESPDHQHMRPHAELPGFQPGLDAPLDHDADTKQRRVLLELLERVEAPILEAFSNSPPHWMTHSGCASGSVDGGPNLPDERIDDFTAYLADVLLAYRDRHGVTFRTIDPFNEPNESWWKADGSQEGCHFPERQQALVIRSLRKALDDRGLTETAISATDAHDIDLTLRNVRRLPAEALAKVGQINTHSYRGSQRRELREFANQHNKRLWQSESGPMNLRGRRRELLLSMMERIALDLNQLRATAWVMWQVIDASPLWGSLHVNDQQQTFEPTPNFALYRQFTRQLRPGDLLLPTSQPNVIASLEASRGQLTFVAVNTEDQAVDYVMAIENAEPLEQQRISATRSSAQVAAAPVEGATIADHRVRFAAAPGSVTTVVVAIAK